MDRPNSQIVDLVRRLRHRATPRLDMPVDLPLQALLNEVAEALEQPHVPVERQGWKLVPLVPTADMEKAAAHEDDAYSNNRFTFPAESRFYNVYCAMLRNAPSPDATEGSGQ